MSVTQVTLPLLVGQAHGPAFARLVQSAIDAPDVYDLTSLAHSPELAQLDSAIRTPLQLLLGGTYTDYARGMPSDLTLSATALEKLRRLTLVTLAGQSSKHTYVAVIEATGVEDSAALEKLLIDAAYDGLVDVRINARDENVTLAALQPRHASSMALSGNSPSTDTLSSIVAALDGWQAQCSRIAADLDAQVNAIYESVRHRKLDEHRHVQAVATAKAGANGLSSVGLGGPRAGAANPGSIPGAGQSIGTGSSAADSSLSRSKRAKATSSSDHSDEGEVEGQASAGEGACAAGRKRKSSVRRQ
ncbi:hypothetical protein PYCC9005_001680 [Savitreella phatthalungensis]